MIAPLPGEATAPEKQEFKWTIQSEASHYAIMVSRDADFSSLVYSNPEVKGNSVTLSESLTPGHYFWRIFLSQPAKVQAHSVTPCLSGFPIPDHR